MAETDWIHVVRRVEGYYSLAKGTVQGNTAGDETLRRNLVPYGNQTMLEILLSRRWGYSYGRTTFAASSSTNTIANVLVPQTKQGGTGTFLTLRRMWIEDSSGFPLELKPANSATLDPTFGTATAAPKSRPQFFFIVGDGNIKLYPWPDQAYTVWVEGEMNLEPIVETVGSVLATTTAVTVPNSFFLLNNPNNLSASNDDAGCSIAGAGYQQYGSGASDLICNGWTANAANLVTINNTAATSVTNYPFFLNSQNWLITWFPKLLEFGLLREVATYFKSQEGYKLWESRFQHEMELAVDFDNERLTALQRMGVAMSGQRTNQLRTLDSPPGYEVRGGII